MNEAFKEGMKEFGRIVVLSVVPVILTSLEAGSVDMRAIILAVTIGLLRALDKFVHEEPTVRANGIVPF